MSRSDRRVDRFQNNMGKAWWWRRYADMLERRQDDGTYTPFDYNQAKQFLPKVKINAFIGTGATYKVKQPGAAVPEKLPRPADLTRQQHRSLFRKACKLQGVPWRSERLFKTPRKERGYNWKDLTDEQLATLEKEWAEYTKNSVEIK
jgi:hypothetical protein